MRKKMKLILAILFLSAQIFAQTDGNPSNSCRNGFFPRENVDFKLGKIKAKKGEKVYFYTDEREDCPAGNNCRKQSYVVAKQEVIVSRTLGSYACVWYQPKKGAETVGWILSNKIEYLNLLQSVDDYAGNWIFYDNEIKITKTKTQGIFKITGTAIWKGLGDNVHTGELDGNAELLDFKLQYNQKDKDEYACKATFDLLGSYLIVTDNLNCGGANVTFSGVYRKYVVSKRTN
jgi:hypothetical protein